MKLLRNIPRLGRQYRHFKWYFAASACVGLGALLLKYIVFGDKHAGAALAEFLAWLSLSVASASLVEIFGAIRRVWEEDERRRRFVELFDCDTRLGGVAVVIPRFPTEKLPDDWKNKNLGGLKAVKRLKDADQRMLAFADVQAAQDIILIFSELNLPLPIIAWDDRLKDDPELNSPNSPKLRCLIAIGLFSNQLTMEMNQISRDLFSLVRSDEPESLSFRIARRPDKATDDPESWGPLLATPNSEGAEYALIARARHTSGATVVIIGGLNSKGTANIGRFIRKKWEKDISHWHDSEEIERSIAGRRFVAAVKFDQASPEGKREVLEVPASE